MVALNRIIHGEAGGNLPPLVIAHGLFGSGRNWGVIARRLAEDRRVVAVDLRNHGDSPWDAAHDYEAMAADLAAVIEDEGGRADLLGHSMGGKVAMVVALTRPELVRRLVVADIAPVAYDHDQLAFIDAMQSVDLAAVRRRGDADAGLARSVADPMLRGFFLQSLALGGETGARWKLNLEALRDEMPKVLAFPAVGAPFEGPALFLTGATSDYVRPEYHARIRALFPAARIETIPGAGHWLHADAPEAFGEAVAAFLAEG